MSLDSFGRSSGILLHITSLPGRYGMGDLGPAASAFASDLAAMGQRFWQTLPVNPAGYAGTPYASPGAFAGYDLLVSTEGLIASGLIAAAEAAPLLELPQDRLDLSRAVPLKNALLDKAADVFLADAGTKDRQAYDAFCAANAAWLDDYALFIALSHSYAWRPWTGWDPELRRRTAQALEAAMRAFAKPIERLKVRQFLFQRDWDAFRRDVNAKGVRLIGDLPIFVSFDSTDVWSHQNRFKLSAAGTPEVVTGVPPDCFSATGQRWGNPHYRWNEMEKDEFRWWTGRFGRARQLFDIVRIDHFIGFSAAYEIPSACPTAEQGEWVEGGGRALFAHLKSIFPDLPMIAEDLGNLTDAAAALRDDFSLPGMKILQFEMERPDAEAPENYPAHSVCYSGTLDNNTIRGWFENDLDDAARAIALKNIGGDARDIHWQLIEKTLKSGSGMAIIPLQDLFGLGEEARMNLPGTAEGNWLWRFVPELLTDAVRERMRALVRAAGRCPE